MWVRNRAIGYQGLVIVIGQRIRIVLLMVISNGNRGLVNVIVVAMALA